MKKLSNSKTYSQLINQKLSHFYLRKGRNFPWRKSGLSLYVILITEILLKRTNSEKVAKHWDSFFSSFRTLNDLNCASLNQLEDKLRPLGLFRQRAIQLKTLAYNVINTHGSLEEVVSFFDLPGVGQYAGNATLLMCGIPSDPPIDSNIIRVFSRIQGTYRLLDTNLVSQTFSGNDIKSAFFGVLDLAASICTPRNPSCSDCPLVSYCQFPHSKICFNSFYEYCPSSAQIIVLSSMQYKKLKTDSFLPFFFEVNLLGRKKICFTYVKKPVTALVGTVSLNMENHQITDFSPLSKNVQLQELNNLSSGINFRSPFTWMKPLKSFEDVIQVILGN
jgi:A/G-specific adenine glycosylase